MEDLVGWNTKQRTWWSALKFSDADLARVIMALAVLVLMAPLIITPNTFYAWVVGKAVYARALILVMGGVWAILAVRNPRYRLQYSSVVAAFGVYLTVVLVATAFSVSPARSFWSVFERMLGVVDLTLGFIYVACLVAVVRSADQWRALLNWGLAAVLAVDVLAVTQMARILDVEGRGFPVCRIGSTTGNPTYFGALLAVALPLSAVLLADHTGRTDVPWRSTPWKQGNRLAWAYRSFLLSSIALGIPMLFFTGSRGALAGVLAGCLVVLAVAVVAGGRRYLQRLALPVGGVFGLVALGALLSVTGVSFAPPGCSGSLAGERLLATTQSAAAVVGDLDDDDAFGAIARASFGERADLWRLAIKSSFDSPRVAIIGWGPENSGAAYERYMDRTYIAEYGALHMSKPHNRVVEELNTSGLVGMTAYLALWLVMGFALVKRLRRSGLPDSGADAGARQPADLVACGVFGGLTGYFVANLFMFDTPATLWHWLLLVGYAAWFATSRTPEAAGADSPESASQSSAPTPRLGKLGNAFLALGVVTVLAAGLFALSVAPYRSAYAFRQFFNPTLTASERLEWAERSFDASLMPTSTLTRLVLRSVRLSWPTLPPETRGVGLRLVLGEIEKNRREEPLETDPILGLTHFILAAAQTREELEQAVPFITLLEEEVPNLPSTVWVRALYRIQRSEPEAALAIIDGYVADAPALDGTFRSLRDAAIQQQASTGIEAGG